MFLKRPDKAAGPAPNKDLEPAPTLTPAQRIRQAEADARIRELEELAAFEAAKRAAEREDWERQRAEKEKETKAERSKVAWRKRVATAIPYTPLVVVNGAAMGGQFDWAKDHLTIGAPGSALRYIAAGVYAVAAESIALFLQYYANRALRNGDSAGSLYLAAFVVAGLVAATNYSHYAAAVPGGGIPTPTAQAVIVALCSLISPWLWRIHSRAEYREELKRRGEIDTRAVRLSMARKVWHPVRSYQVMRRSAWTGITDPAEAVADWERAQEERRTAKARARAERKPVKDGSGRSQGRRRKSEQEIVPGPAGAEDVPPVVQRFPDAWDALVTSWRADNTLSQRALADTHLNGNRHHARAMLTYLETWKEVAA